MVPEIVPIPSVRAIVTVVPDPFATPTVYVLDGCPNADAEIGCAPAGTLAIRNRPEPFVWMLVLPHVTDAPLTGSPSRSTT